MQLKEADGRATVPQPVPVLLYFYFGVLGN